MSNPLPHPVYNLRDWKKEPTKNAILRKGYSLVDRTKAFVNDDGSVSRDLAFAITTDSRDRDRDSIALAGWDLVNFIKNPVVLWAHSYRDLPVAKAIELTILPDKLRALTHFVEAEISGFAEVVYQMYLGGYLSAVSVGFVPLEWTWNDQEGGFDFKRQELLEYSCVPVPANPDALLDAKSAGIDVTPIKLWCEKFLDEYHSDSGLWLPKAKVEEAFKLLSERKEFEVKQPMLVKDKTDIITPTSGPLAGIELTVNYFTNKEIPEGTNGHKVIQIELTDKELANDPDLLPKLFDPVDSKAADPDNDDSSDLDSDYVLMLNEDSTKDGELEIDIDAETLTTIIREAANDSSLKAQIQEAVTAVTGRLD